jgi:uncharacterized SAM-binding protein YcdF (DUF218 family)
MFKLLKWILIIGIIAGLYLYYPNIMMKIGNYLIVSDKLEKCDAILVLAGDNAKGERVIEGAKLFKEGYGNYLILDGTDIGWNTSSADIMEKQALSLNVPSSAIIPVRMDESSTIGEAKASRKFLEKKNFKSLILVSSSYHTRRAKWIFSKVFSETDIKIFAHPSKDSEYNPDKWWKERTSAKHVFYEYTKLIWYMAVERFNVDSFKKEIKIYSQKLMPQEENKN